MSWISPALVYFKICSRSFYCFDMFTVFLFCVWLMKVSLSYRSFYSSSLEMCACVLNLHIDPPELQLFMTHLTCGKIFQIFQYFFFLFWFLSLSCVFVAQITHFWLPHNILAKQWWVSDESAVWGTAAHARSSQGFFSFSSF